MEMGASGRAPYGRRETSALGILLELPAELF